VLGTITSVELGGIAGRVGSTIGGATVKGVSLSGVVDVIGNGNG
jgi:hypothetical protein